MDKKESNKTLELLKKIERLENEVVELIQNEEYEKVTELKVKITTLKNNIEAEGAYHKLIKPSHKHKEILSLLEEHLSKYPDLRFTQALMNLNIIQQEGDIILDPFNNTDSDVLERMKDVIKR